MELVRIINAELKTGIFDRDELNAAKSGEYYKHVVFAEFE
jgi:hypothetical protein